MTKRKTVHKEPIDKTRIRQIPKGFSWIDRRFIREGWIERLNGSEILLYLFLVSVSDRHGLSYYSDPRICGLLQLGSEEFLLARQRLVELDLIAFKTPLYQVLDLEIRPSRWRRPSPRAQADAASFAATLRQIIEKRS